MMRYLLAPGHRRIVDQFAWSNVLLAFDYDGTLAPIVDDPAAARMRPPTRQLLERLALRYPCAVISGRARHDALLWLEGIHLVNVVGNHGLEPWKDPERFARVVAGWRTRLQQELAPLAGVEIEDKQFSLAIHYRRSRSKRAARAAIEAAVAGLGGVRTIAGKLVVNVLPPDAPHKGLALERLRVEQGCDTALFVGDDETDEDVFALDRPGQLLSVRVGARRRSQAAYFLKNQEEIDVLLEILLRARRRCDLERSATA
jgi:trehalose 6-phosphate phosphatase